LNGDASLWCRGWIRMLALGVVGALASAGPASADTGLTLEDAIALALERNPQVRQARADVETAGARVDHVRADYYPRISLGAGADRLTLNSASPRAARSELDFSPILPGDDNVVTVDEPPRDMWGFTRFSSDVRAEFVLWDFGQRSKELESARHDRSAARARHSGAEADTVLAVAEAYFDLLQADAMLDVRQDFVERRREAAELAERLMGAGRATRGDLARADADLARAEADLIEARNDAERQRLRLARAMGVRAGSMDLRVDGHSRIRDPGEWGDALEEPEWAEEHPGVRAQLEAVKARRAELERHRRSFRPVLQAAGNYRVEKFQEGGTAPNYTVGVELRWEFFDGGRRQSRIAEARAQQQHAAAAREELHQEVLARAREAEQDLAESNERIEFTRRALAASREDLRMAEAGYREGVRRFGELSDAQLDVAEAEARVAVARFDRQKALARLYWALGRLPVDALRHGGDR